MRVSMFCSDGSSFWMTPPQSSGNTMPRSPKCVVKSKWMAVGLEA